MVRRQKPEEMARTILPFGALRGVGEGGGEEPPSTSRETPAPGAAAGEGTPPSKRRRGTQEQPTLASVAQVSLPQQKVPQTQDMVATEEQATREAAAAAAVAAPALTRAREIADQRLHVMVTPSEMAYLRDLARRKAGELGRVFGGSASIGQVVRFLIHYYQGSEQEKER